MLVPSGPEPAPAGVPVLPPSRDAARPGVGGNIIVPGSSAPREPAAIESSSDEPSFPQIKVEGFAPATSKPPPAKGPDTLSPPEIKVQVPDVPLPTGSIPDRFRDLGHRQSPPQPMPALPPR